MGSEAEAGLVEFLELWRSSESLRQQIKRIVENDCTDNGRIEADDHSDDKSPLSSIDVEAIAPQIEKHLTQSYGGLSRKELYVLLEQHKAGKRDLGAYLLVRAWKKHVTNPDESPDVRLERLTLDYFKRAIADNRTDFFREIADIVEFLQGEEFKEDGQWNHDPGQWWQFHLLLYILEHPKEAYAMREFVHHFEHEVGTNEMPTTKTLRAFCRSNGIALDSTPGAPKRKKVS